MNAKKPYCRALWVVQRYHLNLTHCHGISVCWSGVGFLRFASFRPIIGWLGVWTLTTEPVVDVFNHFQGSCVRLHKVEYLKYNALSIRGPVSVFLVVECYVVVFRKPPLESTRCSETSLVFWY